MRIGSVISPLSMAAGAALLWLGSMLGQYLGTPGVTPASAAAIQRSTGRLIVGVKPGEPVLPTEVVALGKQLGARIINVAPDGGFMLVLPKRGTTPGKIRSRSGGRVVSVDQEIYMGTPESLKSLLLVVPIRRLPYELMSPSEKKAARKKPHALRQLH